MLHKSLIHSRFSNYFIKLQAGPLVDFKDLGRLKHNIYNIYYAKRSIIQILLNVKKQRNKRKH